MLVVVANELATVDYAMKNVQLVIRFRQTLIGLSFFAADYAGKDD